MIEEYRIYLETYLFFILMVDESCEANKWICQEDLEVQLDDQACTEEKTYFPGCGEK